MQKKRLTWAAISQYRSEIMGLACLWVVFHHFTGDLSFYPLKRLSVYGNAGVDIFLFLSGIGLYFAFQKKEPLGVFYKKRMVRLLIPYLLICVPYYVWKALCYGEGNLFLDITQLSFPLSHMITTWYIPAMLVFYLLFPLVYHLQNSIKINNRNVWSLFLCVAYMMALLVIKNIAPAFYENTEIALTRFIIFFVGCYFGRAVLEKKPLPVEGVALSAVCVLICVLLRDFNGLSAFWIRLSYAPLAVALCILSVYLMLFLKENHVVLRVLRFLGEHSLEIYLTHVLINNVWGKVLGTRFLDPTGTMDYLAVVLISLAVSVPAHWLITKWSLLLLKKRGVAKG